MAATRTQKEIRQRAPIWLVMLLIMNFAVMAVDANRRFTQQQTIKGLAQAVFSPIQTQPHGFPALAAALSMRSSTFAVRLGKTELERTSGPNRAGTTQH